ncbi:Adenylyl cyclase-associated protein [Candida viswanathii]|uniref:Adenylyl cyclase-associated protein n=1 Tax=Candida viswanathii TaxID=5486 RepID=A0A367YAF7_9ASCO|nr:Adenylyl cyclase-associated protein [Candida viswanathii]
MSTEESQFNVQGYNIVTILKRLEAATSRLEDITIFQEEANKKKFGVERIGGKAAESSFTPSGEASSTPAPASKAIPAKSSAPAPVAANPADESILKTLAEFVETSKNVDASTGEAAQLFKDTFEEVSNAIKKGDPSNKEALTNALKEKILKIFELKEAARSNYLNALGEASNVVIWVFTDEPVQYVADIKDTAVYWTNKVIKDNKPWVQQLLAVFEGLKTYVKGTYAKGGPFSEAYAAANPAPVAKATPTGGAAPPPPPPPPPASVFDSAPAASSAALFQEINQGSAITSGLKKVSPSEMTHKNPELRKQVPRPPKKPSSLAGSHTGGASTAATNQPPKTPKKELVDNKWQILHHSNTDSIITIDVEAQQSVFISNCDTVTIQLKGKANNVFLSNNKNVSLVIDSLISGIDVVKAAKFGIQVLGLVPTINIDKSDEGTIYLSKESVEHDIQIVTSSTTALNINVPKGDDDYSELAAPEQILSRIVDGKLVSEIVEHAG